MVQSWCSPGTSLQRLNQSNYLVIPVGRLQNTDKVKEDKIKCVDFALPYVCWTVQHLDS